MTDFTALWNIGPSITGQTIGTPYQQFRGPTTGQPIGTVKAWITADNKGEASKPFVFGKPVGASLHDPTKTQVGDYLVGAQGTFFVASQDVPAPIQVVKCNRVVTLLRPDADGSGVGSLPPGGQTAGTDNALITAWPASVLIKTRGEAGQALLPGDTKLALFETLLPATIGVTLRTSDLMTDDQGRRFTVSAAELTDLGWRLYTQLSVT